MNCPYCTISDHPSFYRAPVLLSQTTSTGWAVGAMKCPSCDELIIELNTRTRHRFNSENYSFIALPKNPRIKQLSSEVPVALSNDYLEARKVLPISPKASAALSRRCLQIILNDHGYTRKNLAQQVDAVIAETDPSRVLPQALIETIDTIRNFGNFSAHPIDDITTNQIIDVEEHEAEYCLEILDEMFDHFYVRPARLAAKKASLNAKLAAAGKPPSK